MPQAMDEHGLAFNWRDVPEIKSLAEAAAYLLEVAESYKFPFSYPDVEDAAEDIRIALAVLEAT